MTEIKHTPLPWKIGESKKDGLAYTKHIEFDGMGRTSIGFVVAPSCSQTMIDQADANAEFIVRACNSHYDLIAALEEAQKTLAMMIAPDAIKQTTVLNAYAAAVEAEYKARQALSKAKGDTE